MQDFIVLGIIPGTNIQIDFNDWLMMCLCLFVTYVLLSFVLRRVHIRLPFTDQPNTNTALIGPIDTGDTVAA